MISLLRFLDRYHWLWIVFSAPFYLFPTPQRAPFLLLLPYLWLMLMILDRTPLAKARRSFLPVTPLNLSLLLLAVMICTSVWVTDDIKLSLEKLSGVMLGFGLFFAVLRETGSPTRWLYCYLFFLLGGGGVALVGLLYMNYQIRFSFFQGLITTIQALQKNLPGGGFRLQHNALGGTLLWVLPGLITFCLVKLHRVQESISSSRPRSGHPRAKNAPLIHRDKQRESKQGSRKTIYHRGRLYLSSSLACWISHIRWPVTIFVFLVLLLTQSRGSYLAFLFSGYALLMIWLPGGQRWIFLIISALGLGGIVLLFVNFSSWNEILAWRGWSAQPGFSLDTLSVRVEIWSKALLGISDFPYLGMGMNTFREKVFELYPSIPIVPVLDIAHAHNEFLQAALDLGIPGLVAFLSIYLICFWMLWQIWRQRRDPSAGDSRVGNRAPFSLDLHQAVVIGLGGGLFAHMLFGMTDAVSLGAKPGIFYWMLLGLITSYYLNHLQWDEVNHG